MSGIDCRNIWACESTRGMRQSLGAVVIASSFTFGAYFSGLVLGLGPVGLPATRRRYVPVGLLRPSMASDSCWNPYWPQSFGQPL